MKLFILFGQRTQSYDGQYAPEALLCWDEYCVDENPDAWEKAVKAEQEKAEKDFSSTAVVVVNVNGDKIAKILNATPEIDGRIED